MVETRRIRMCRERKQEGVDAFMSCVVGGERREGKLGQHNVIIHLQDLQY